MPKEGLAQTHPEVGLLLFFVINLIMRQDWCQMVAPQAVAIMSTINNGLLIGGGTPPIVIISCLNGTLPIQKQPRGLLIQG